MPLLMIFAPTGIRARTIVSMHGWWATDRTVKLRPDTVTAPVTPFLQRAHACSLQHCLSKLLVLLLLSHFYCPLASHGQQERAPFWIVDKTSKEPTARFTFISEGIAEPTPFTENKTIVLGHFKTPTNGLYVAQRLRWIFAAFPKPMPGTPPALLNLDSHYYEAFVFSDADVQMFRHGEGGPFPYAASFNAFRDFHSYEFLFALKKAAAHRVEMNFTGKRIPLPPGALMHYGACGLDRTHRSDDPDGFYVGTLEWDGDRPADDPMDIALTLGNGFHFDGDGRYKQFPQAPTYLPTKSGQSCLGILLEPVSLQFESDGGGLILKWNEGLSGCVVQSNDSLSDTGWQDVPQSNVDEKNSLRVVPGGKRKFFRIRSIH